MDEVSKQRVLLGVSALLGALVPRVQDEPHLSDTPIRVLRAFVDSVRGYKEDPEEILKRQFLNGTYDQMIHVRRIKVLSTCSHHLLPIIGLAHFAYLPGKHIVGLSKIPRLVDAFARRLQVQENLTEEIVDTFQKVVEPKGCGISIRAFHCCAAVRGIEQQILMDTTALRGVFRENTATRQEFLSSIDITERII
jgi:GTP cyclohydrolase I